MSIRDIVSASTRLARSTDETSQPRDTGAEQARAVGPSESGDQSDPLVDTPGPSWKVPREWVAERWTRTRVSLHPTSPDYRARPPSTAHAVCSAEFCEVHFDDHHPRERPLGHLTRDAVPALVRRARWLRGLTEWEIGFEL
jgi:hypothetical protein